MTPNRIAVNEYIAWLNRSEHERTVCTTLLIRIVTSCLKVNCNNAAYQSALKALYKFYCEGK